MSDQIDLSMTFAFQGWKIAYNVLTSTSSSSTSISASSNSTTTRNVVFVHGTPWSSTVFKPIIDAILARGSFRILVYDLPGYGQSQEFDNSSGGTPAAPGNIFEGDTSVKFQAKALTALLQHVELDGKNGHAAPAVIAHDIAGTIVLRTHTLDLINFDSMLLLDTNCVLPWGDGFYTLARSEPQTFLKLPPSIFEAVVRAVIQSAVHNPKVLQNEWEDILARPWIGDKTRQRSFMRQIAQANDGDVAEMLEVNAYERVECDVKIIWGEQDQWIPKKKIEDLIDRMKGKVKEFVVVPDAGHLVMLDQPVRVAVEIFDWLVRA